MILTKQVLPRAICKLPHWRSLTFALVVGTVAPSHAWAQSPAPQLLVNTTETSAGEIILASVIFPGKSSAQPISGSLSVPEGASVWLFDPKSGCDKASAESNRVLFSNVAFGEVRLCIRFDEEGIFRLLATLAPQDADPMRVQSEQIKVTGGFVLNPTIAGIISALAGFLAGILSHALQKVVEDRLEQKKGYVEAEKALVSSLGPEITSNAQALTAYLAKPGQTAPQLKAAAYNVLTKQALGFLERSKPKYLAHLQALYNGTNDFHEMVQRSEQDQALREQATRVLDLIAKLPTEA